MASTGTDDGSDVGDVTPMNKAPASEVGSQGSPNRTGRCR